MDRLRFLIGIFVVTIFVSGCVTSTPTYDASGKAAHVIKCGGLLMGWGTCYAKAGEICGSNGYTVVSKDSSDRTSISVTSGDAFGSKTESRSLVITCN